jgi:hypothetical protein
MLTDGFAGYRRDADLGAHLGFTHHIQDKGLIRLQKGAQRTRRTRSAAYAL